MHGSTPPHYTYHKVWLNLVSHLLDMALFSILYVSLFSLTVFTSCAAIVGEYVC